MKVVIDRRGARRRWHGALLERLVADGHLACVWSDASAQAAEVHSGSLRTLLRLEHASSAKSRRNWMIDPPGGDEPQRGAGGPDPAPDLIIDVGHTPGLRNDGVRTLVPTFDGVPGEAAMWNALLAARAPVLGVHDSHTGLATSLALPALETPHRLLDSAEAVLTHLVAAIARAVSEIGSGKPIAPFATNPPPPTSLMGETPSASKTPSALPALGRRIAGKVSAKRDALLKRDPVWQVGWRRIDARLDPPQSLDPALYTRLPDDGQRYYADPFLFVHEGRHHLLVEEFPYATNRGVISHTVIEPDGTVRTPRVVLGEPHHLSYPQVFEHEGRIYMLPEAQASGRLDLYRAERFPDGWVRHATLIDAPLHDATLFRHGGRFWITAGLQLPGASSWDTLVLYHAERLQGPWVAHPLNPLLVDARSARPAGEVYMHDGQLWRPAQDCTQGYGAALSLARVTRLDPEGFAQDLVQSLHFGPPQRHAGPHTLNFAAGIEVVDFFLPRSDAT